MTPRRTLLLTPLALFAAPKLPIYSNGYPKSFLYPITAPDGTVLSRGWPIAPRPGDSEDHTWHRGIWWGHGDINGHDFWREQKGTASIRVDQSKATRNAITLEQSLITVDGKRLGRLTTRYQFHYAKNTTIIDATITITGDEPLRFGDTDDGGFAFRLREEFREDRGATLLNSEGQKGAKQIWGKPAAWTDYSAMLNNQRYGVAIFSHPRNLRHPAGWHARNYGLNSVNPFAASSFANEKGGQRGAHTQPANTPLTLRYRVLIHQGEVNIPALYAQYEKDSQR